MGSDLSALVPPLLVCAVFVVAVVAFIRHEMRRGGEGSADRAGEDRPPENEPADSGTTGDDDAFGPERKADYQQRRRGAGE